MTEIEVKAAFCQIEAALTGFIPAWATEAKSRIVQRTPVRSGALRDAWADALPPGAIEINNTMPYAHMIELGTIHMRPQPMVRTTVLEVDQITEVAKKKVGLE